MTSQLSTIICVIFGVVSWYYFNKFMESEREYSRLHKSYDELHMENKKMKSRLKDLQSYKNDVSKTFKILDNELVLINDHLKRNSQQNTQQSQTNFPITSSIPIGRIPLARVASFTALQPNNNISLLTPELLTSLFNMNTEEINHQIPNQQVHENTRLQDQLLPNQPLPNQPLPNQPLPNQPLPNQPLPNQPLQEEPLQEEPLQEEPLPNQPLQEEPLQEEPRLRDISMQNKNTDDYHSYENVYNNANYNTVQQIMYDMSCNEYDQFLINNN
jgi:hypothetical protein